MANPPESPKSVSPKKILYIELDDEITVIFDRVKHMKVKDIYLVVPRQALLFQSLVNLKILKRKIEEIGKNLQIITNDRNGVHLCQQISLSVYERIATEGKFQKPVEDEEMRITPLKATINALEDDRPMRRKEKKVSISEILDQRKKKKIPILSEGLDFFWRKKDSNPKETQEAKLVLVAPNRKALFALVSISALLLLIIFYVALPGVTILLTAKSNVIEHSANITFANYEANKSLLDRKSSKVLALYPIEVSVQRKIIHLSSGKIFQGENAKGVITIINTRSSPWQLIQRTRFQTPDGIVFRIGQSVSVPANASRDVPVTADEFDAFSQPIGERGNIGPAKFFLPGLSPENQKLLSGESKAPMAGGKTVVKKQISEDDIKAATERMRKELEQAALEELQKTVDEKTLLLGKNVKFSLLKGKGAYSSAEPKIDIPPNLAGQPFDQFEITGTVKANGVYFNMEELLEIMRAELKGKKNPQKRLVKIDEESMTYRIFDTDQNAKTMKVTATMKAIEEYDLDASKSTGERLIEKIKEHIVGKRIQDAKDYIINLPEIAQVEIKSWPVWAPTIPTVPDNIDVEVK